MSNKKPSAETSAAVAVDGTVYIIQHPRPKADGWVPDFSPAAQYGKLAFVFDVGDRAYADPASAKRKAMQRLANFDSDKDFLLWGNFGDPATLWLTIMLLVRRGDHRLKFLYWSRGRIAGEVSNDAGFYFPVEIDVEALPLLPK